MQFDVLVIVGVIAVVVIVALMLRQRGRDVTVVPSVPLQPSGVPPLAPGDGDAEVAQLLARGNKIEAIKLVRERTGLGLKEAKDYVETLPNAPALASFEVPAAARPTGSIDDEARTLLAKGQKIVAIKLVRERTGWGLKEAKDYVDELEKH